MPQDEESPKGKTGCPFASPLLPSSPPPQLSTTLSASPTHVHPLSHCLYPPPPTSTSNIFYEPLILSNSDCQPTFTGGSAYVSPSQNRICVPSILCPPPSPTPTHLCPPPPTFIQTHQRTPVSGRLQSAPSASIHFQTALRPRPLLPTYARSPTFADLHPPRWRWGRLGGGAWMWVEIGEGGWRWVELGESG